MKTILTLTLFSMLSGLSFGQDFQPFDNDHWDFISGKTEIIDQLEAFAGVALLKNVVFANGIIEWDIKVTGDRSYAGIIFHQQPNRDYEEFYVRPHKANGLLPDAFQYCPAYHGVSCWQLYHGEAGTMPARIETGEWIHFSMTIIGDRAQVSMNGEPMMMINKLQLGAKQGRIGIKGPADGTVWFSNFSYQQDIGQLPDPPPVAPPAPGVIGSWEITQPFSHETVDPYAYYDKLKNIEWKTASADQDGLVNLTRELVRNPVLPGWTYARTFLEADHDHLHRFQIGYSDNVTLFINGVAHYSGTNGYLSRDPAFAGLIGYFDEVILPLIKGNNEICLLVGEQFGGWGLMMRDGEAVMKNDNLTKTWEISHHFNFPESVVFDPSENLLYVTNYLRGASEYISKVTVEGKIVDKEWISGLQRPTGICLFKDKVYVVERTQVAEIDKTKGTIVNRIPLPGAIFPNDITVSNDGKQLYISDNESNRIYIIENGVGSIWMEGGALRKPNGLRFDKNRLLVGCSGDYSLKSIDLLSREVTVLATLYPGAVMDGIQALGGGKIVFSDFNGHLFLYRPDGELTEILNTSTVLTNLADFEWIPEKKLLVIPGLYSNVLTAWRFDLQ